MRVWIVGLVTVSLIRRLVRIRFCTRQAPDLPDPVAADAVGQEPRVTDSVEPARQDVDQEDQAVVRDCDPVRVTAQVRQDCLGAAEGRFGKDDPFGFAQRHEL